MAKKMFLIIVFLVILSLVIYIFLNVPEKTEEKGVRNNTNTEIKKEENIGLDADEIEEMEEKRKKVILAVSKDIDNLVHSTANKLNPVMFWFEKENVDVQYFYVDYIDGEIVKRILLQAEEIDKELKFSIIGTFTSGEDFWELEEGKDYLSGKLLDIYKYDQDADTFIKKN